MSEEGDEVEKGKESLTKIIFDFFDYFFLEFWNLMTEQPQTGNAVGARSQGKYIKIDGEKEGKLKLEGHYRAD